MKFGLIDVLISFIITIAFIMISLHIVESFGSRSPGALVQLMSTQQDLDYYKNVYPKQVRKEISRLTGSDPGPITVYP